MHGEIELESELGRGTSTTFWICFHKPHLTAAVQPPIKLRPTPSRLEPEPSTTERHFRHQKTGDARPKISSVAPNPLLANPALDASQLFTAIKPPSHTEEEPLSVHDIDRKKIHILVVEDK